MNKKNGLVLVVMLLTAVMASAFASAATIPLDIDWVKVDGDTFESGDTIEFERGEDLDLRVRVTATADIEDVEIEAYISGYRYAEYERDMVSDYERIGDLRMDSSDTVSLSLEIPTKIKTEDAKLRIRVSNKNDESQEYTYQLDIVGIADENAIVIKDFTVSPSTVVEAGRPLSFKVKVKNLGDNDLDDVSVKVSIPELGITDDEYLDEIEANEAETFEELLLRIPQCAAAGTYTVTANVEFDEYEETSESMTITVLESGACEVNAPKVTTDKTVVTVPETQEVVLGTTGGVYPVMISNLGSTAKTYTLTASGVSAWGTVRFDPGAVVVVQPESVKTVYMYVAASEDAQAGAQVFKLAIEGDDDEKQVVLTANVQEGEDAASYDSLRRGLEIGLIVLVVILIILGLIIGFNKLRSDKGDDDDQSQTYY